MRNAILSVLGTFILGAVGFAGPATRPAEEIPAARSAAGEVPSAVAVDDRGNSYVAGVTSGRGSQSVYVTKIDSSGRNRVYTAHLGGSGTFRLNGIAVDLQGQVFIAGCTNSPDLPAHGVQRKSAGGMDAFAAKLDAKGNTWLYTTYLGGSGDDCASSIAIDLEGRAYLTGWTRSSDFPMRRPLQANRIGETDAFVTKLEADGSALAWSTYAGGGSLTAGRGIAVDEAGAVFVAGEVQGRGGIAGLIEGAPAAKSAFLVKLASDGSRTEFSRFASGSDEGGATAVAVDGAGAAYVAGWRQASGDRKCFAAKYGADGERLYNTMLGDCQTIAPLVAVDAAGAAYVTGAAEVIKLSADGASQLASSPIADLTASGAVQLAVSKSGAAMIAGSKGAGRSYLGRVSTCGFRLDEAMKQIAAAGQSGSISIETTPECAWTASASASWVEVDASGAGAGHLRFTVAPNSGAPRGASIAIAGQTVFLLQGGVTPKLAGGISGAIRPNAGFATSNIPACDDCSAGLIAPMGFSISFYGNPYSSVWVNNNGNVTFNAQLSAYTPNPIPTSPNVIIAPFWADVDTRGTGSGITTYGQDTVDGHHAFGVNWVNVGYYNSAVDKLNSFQLVLIDRSDVGAGFFDIEMNYSSIKWETGGASGGTGGLGGFSARVGFTNGSNTTGTNFELPGSGVNGAFLDGGPNALASNSVNSSVAGRYLYPVRASANFCATGISPAAAALTNTGGQLTVAVSASQSSCTWTVTNLPSWISVVSPTNGNGTGSGNVVLQVATNTGSLRSATMVIATQNYTVTQGGVDLRITKTHSGSWQPGDTGRTYTISVGDIGGSPTSGTVTVVDSLPTGLTATAISGSGWSCTLASLTCTRSDVLAALGTYPAITLTVNVAGNAPTSVTNTATVSGGGDVNSANNIATDVTGIGPPDLTITKTHSATFHQGDVGLLYTLTVTNSGGAATSGTVTVVDTLPTGLTATAIAGVGWTCTLATRTCTRVDSLAPGLSYPAIVVTVNVASNAPGSVTNIANVSGGGESNANNNSSSDITSIGGVGSDLTISKSHSGSFFQGGTGFTYTITVSNSGSSPTSGSVTVTDTLPVGLTATSISGTGWGCTLATLLCTRTDSLAVSASYPAITLTVSAASNAPTTVTNVATVSGGGETNTSNDTSSDLTSISPSSFGCASSFIGSWDPYLTITQGTDGYLKTTDYFGATISNGFVVGNVLNTMYRKFQISADGTTLFEDTYNGGNNYQGRFTRYPGPGNAPIPCGATTSPALWLGEWIATPFGRILATMNQDGTVTLTVPASCTFTGGVFIGTPAGTSLTGTYSSPGGGGTFSLVLSLTSNFYGGYTFAGTYTPTAGASVTWTGARGMAPIPSAGLSNKVAPIAGIDETAAAFGFNGRWNTPFGLLTLKVNTSNNTVTGTYPSFGTSTGGTITGTVSASSGFGPPNYGSGTTLTGTYSDSSGTGPVSWIIASDMYGLTFRSNTGVNSPWIGGRAASWQGTWSTAQGNFIFARSASTGFDNPSDITYGGARIIGTLGTNNFGFGVPGGNISELVISGQLNGPGGNGGGFFVINPDGLTFSGTYSHTNVDVVTVNGTYVSNSLAGLNVCPATLSPFTGTFNTTMGVMTVTQNANGTATGTIPGGPTFTGTVTGNTWSGTYTGPGGSGTFSFTTNGFGFSGTTTPLGGVPTGFVATPVGSSTAPMVIQTNPPGLQIQVDGVTMTAPTTVYWVAGTSHTLSAATPQVASSTTRYAFNDWSDFGSAVHGVIAPSLSTTYTADFTTQYQLTMTAGTGGTVIPVTGFYNSGQGVQITATAAAGFTFTGWSGSGPGSYTGTNNPAFVTVNGGITQTATFAALTPVTISTNPVGLTVIVDGTSLVTPQVMVWSAGSTHTLNVTSPQSSGGAQNVFTSWTDGGAQSHTVTAPASAISYIASFTPQFQLTTSASPSNGGTVSASPTSSNGFYNGGTVVQLTAIANGGFVFQGWSGDATGTNNPISVTMSTARNVTAVFVSLSTSGMGFFPMTPCRVVDTRAGSGKTGSFGAPSMSSQQTRAFPITSGSCNVPASARAFSVNITAIPAQGLGFLTVWPTGASQPGVSTLNSSDGGVVANGAIVPAGTNGSINVFVTDFSDVIIDINGYFAPPSAQALAFYPLTPCRIMDTRFGAAPFGAPALPFNSTRDVPVQQSNCGVPATAQAYSMNMTALPRGQLGFVTSWPTGQQIPVASTLNSFLGKAVANAFIAQAGTGGSISLYASETTDLILDINGYFAPPGAPGALFFYNVTPCRVADTRGGISTFGGPVMGNGAQRDFPIPLSSCGIPTSARAYSLNFTVVPPGPLTFLSTWPQGQSIPNVSTLNSFDGRILANAAIVPSGTNGGVSVFVSNTTHVIIDVNGYFAQ